MASPKDHRLYPIILKQVLWDEEEAKIRKRLAVNEVSEEDSEAIFQAARKERVTTLRKKHGSNFLKGLTAFLVGGLVLAIFQIKYDLIHIGVLSGAGIFLLAGFLLMLIGALGFLAAPRKRGSIADED